MTGPEQRVLSGYHAISGVKKPVDHWEIRKDKKFSNFDLPELLHNLNLLVEIAEQVNIMLPVTILLILIKYLVLLQNIVTNNQELCNSEDRLIFIEQETHKLGDSIQDKDKSIESLEKMIVIMESLNDALKNNMLDSNQAIKRLSELKVCTLMSLK